MHPTWMNALSCVNSSVDFCACAGTWSWELQRLRISLCPAKFPGGFQHQAQGYSSLTRAGSAPAQPGHSRADGLITNREVADKVTTRKQVWTVPWHFHNKNASVRYKGEAIIKRTVIIEMIGWLHKCWSNECLVIREFVLTGIIHKFKFTP